jgi:hypothetical protein
VEKLALRDGLRTLVFRKIVALFQANEILKRTIKPSSWYVWNGRVDQKAGTFATGELPALRLTPISIPAEPLTNVRWQSSWTLRIETAVSGTNMDDAFNLWDAIHNVIFTGDGSKAALEALQSLSASVTPAGQNVHAITLGTPSFTPNPQGLPDDMILGEGDITIVMTVPR